MTKIQQATQKFNDALHNMAEAFAKLYWRHRVYRSMLSEGFSKKDASEMAQAADMEFFEIWEDGKRDKFSRLSVAAMEGAREYRLDEQSRAPVTEWSSHDWVSSRKGTPIEIVAIIGRGSKARVSFKHANHGATHTFSVPEFLAMAKRV
ncbi:hypothetical protein vBSlqSZDD2_31 [Serratia phage vB_SlqS_ZDD2]|nr:hypothetical protein vBSlqSZDD2_31 [Serratia phage vB_SlqS_ZDD2]